MGKHRFQLVRHQPRISLSEVPGGSRVPFTGSRIAHHLTGEISRDGNQVETWCGRWMALELALHAADAIDCEECVRAIEEGEKKFTVTAKVGVGFLGKPRND